MSLSFGGLLIAIYAWSRKRAHPNLLPGSPRLPLISNLHQAPKEAVRIQYQKWSEQYGSLVYLKFGGTDVIFIGDHEVAKDLLEKRANVYSSRPRMVC